MRKVRTKDEFIYDLARINPTITLVGSYVNTKTDTLFKCEVCGNQWETKPRVLLRGCGCPKCAKDRKSRPGKTTEQFIRELAVSNPTVTVTGQYMGASKPIDACCAVCGNCWTPRAGDILRGHGCPECKKKTLSKLHHKSHETFESQLAEINPRVRLVGKYVDSKTPITVQCLTCGEEWLANPDDLLGEHGCPKCAQTSSSYAEQFIYWAFVRSVGKEYVRTRDRCAIGQELDIYVPESALAIEFGSWHWHKNKLKTDAEKARLCKEAGIRLVTIYDACREDMIPDFEYECLTYSFDLAREKGRVELKQLTFDLVNIATAWAPDDIDWNFIARKAAESSHARTSAEFKAQLRGINPEIEIVGTYSGNNKRIKARCLVCGNEWYPTPANLLSGSKCPRCVNVKKRMQLDEFIDKLATENPDIEYIEGYEGVSKRASVRCKRCGHVWSPVLRSLFYGSKCPQCVSQHRFTQEEFEQHVADANPDVLVIGVYQGSTKRVYVKCANCGNEWNPLASSVLAGHGCLNCSGCRKKTTETFIEELKEKNPSIIVLGEYVNNKTQIKVRCKECGREWKAIPKNLLNGHGCRNCSGTR